MENQSITRAQFEDLVQKALSNIMQNGYNDFSKNILGPEKRRRDAGSLLVFLQKAKQDLVNSNDWRAYDWHTNNGGLSTLKAAAFMIAQTIEDEGPQPFDWYECWTKSLYFENDIFKVFQSGLKLEGRVQAVKDFIKNFPEGQAPSIEIKEEETDKIPSKVEKRQLPPIFFDDLFVGDTDEDRIRNLEIALDAARKAGLIEYDTVNWKLGKRMKAVIAVFWAALKKAKLAKTNIHFVQACQAIAKRFNTSYGRSSIYESWRTDGDTYYGNDNVLKPYYIAILEGLTRK